MGIIGSHKRALQVDQTGMLNIYDYIANSEYYKTFKVDDVLVVEYKCMLPGDRVAFWTHCNYFAYILSGDIKYSTAKGEVVARNGEAVFVKKGSYVAEHHDTGDYCALVIFVTDDFIQRVADKYPSTSKKTVERSADVTDSVFHITVDDSLSSYFHSVLSYFPRANPPSDELLKVKAEELLLNIFTSGHHPSLALGLRGIRKNGKISLRDVMETSFMHPMSLEEYARLCGRSLSAFKTDFLATYKTPPGRWLIRTRLQYAKILMETTDDSVNDIAFRSGFKNTAHFVKVFRDSFGMPPLQYRRKEAVA